MICILHFGILFGGLADQAENPGHAAPHETQREAGPKDRGIIPGRGSIRQFWNFIGLRHASDGPEIDQAAGFRPTEERPARLARLMFASTRLVCLAARAPVHSSRDINVAFHKFENQPTRKRVTVWTVQITAPSATRNVMPDTTQDTIHDNGKNRSEEHTSELQS